MRYDGMKAETFAKTFSLELNSPMKNVTIKDIAKVAGVSYATVSRALSGSTEISSETRERVVKLCKDMGYTTNYVARSMVKRRTNLIGLIVGSVDNPFMSEIAYNIECTARENGYNIMLCNSAHDLDLEERVFELLLGRQVDGIIIVPSSADSYGRIQKYLDKVPTVFVSENLRDVPESYVAVDNYRGTFIGTEYLYSLGHRDILYLGRRARSTTHQLRADGYSDACRASGVEPRFFDSPYSASSIESGYTLAKQVFKNGCRHTAIFAATDTLALGVLQAADECGIRVPEELSLLGFDNIHYTELPKINLSTIEQPKKTMAHVAVEMLLEKIQRATIGYSHRILTPTLVARSSCLPLGQAGTGAAK